MPNTKKSMKPIPSSMRGKKRYILAELQCEHSLPEKEVQDALWKTFHRLYGELGTAQQKLWFVKFSAKNNRFIVRCALERTDEVRAGMLFIKEVAGCKVIPKTILTSGSMAKLKSKF
jgi:ribonuclease P/MRP protein subunit POP5